MSIIKWEKFYSVFWLKKGRLSTWWKYRFWKIFILWIYCILCSYGAFDSIVLFDMLLRSNDFKYFVFSEYRKYHVAYFMWNSLHCYQFWFWITLLEIVLAKDWILRLFASSRNLYISISFSWSRQARDYWYHQINSSIWAYMCSK